MDFGPLDPAQRFAAFLVVACWASYKWLASAREINSVSILVNTFLLIGLLIPAEDMRWSSNLKFYSVYAAIPGSFYIIKFWVNKSRNRPSRVINAINRFLVVVLTLGLSGLLLHWIYSDRRAIAEGLREYAQFLVASLGMLTLLFVMAGFGLLFERIRKRLSRRGSLQ